MLLCSNCENAIATFKCNSCADDDAPLCSDCTALHSKIKAFKHHRFSIVAKESFSCSNCESAVAKFICRSCPATASDRYLCLGCSVIHPKVKAFRDHVIVIMEAKEARQDSSLNSLSISDRLHAPQSFLEDLGTFVRSMIELGYDNIHNKSYRDMEYWQTVSGIAVIVLTYYGLVKMVFRDYSSLVNICVGIVLYKVLQSVRVPLNKSNAVSTIANELMDDCKTDYDRLSNAGIDPWCHRKRGGTRVVQQQQQPRGTTHDELDNSINDSKSFMSESRRVKSTDDVFEGSNEFWYSTESKRASFRPRTRPYRRSAGKSSSDAASNTID